VPDDRCGRRGGVRRRTTGPQRPDADRDERDQGDHRLAHRPAHRVLFELETTAGGIGNSLFLRLTRDAPVSTRRALSGQVLLFTCRLPHRRVRTFAQR
jgi:hypothetical protein